jgi:hypothetical protein
MRVRVERVHSSRFSVRAITDRPQPDRNVISWLAEVDEDRVFISVISFAEIRRE